MSISRYTTSASKGLTEAVRWNEPKKPWYLALPGLRMLNQESLPECPIKSLTWSSGCWSDTDLWFSRRLSGDSGDYMTFLFFLTRAELEDLAFTVQLLTRRSWMCVWSDLCQGLFRYDGLCLLHRNITLSPLISKLGLPQMSFPSIEKSIGLLKEDCPDNFLLLFFQLTKVYRWGPLGLGWSAWLKSDPIAVGPLGDSTLPVYCNVGCVMFGVMSDYILRSLRRIIYYYICATAPHLICRDHHVFHTHCCPGETLGSAVWRKLGMASTVSCEQKLPCDAVLPGSGLTLNVI